MISIRLPHDQTVFGSGSFMGGTQATSTTPPLQTLKKRRREAAEQEEEQRGRGGDQYEADSEENPSLKRRRNVPFHHNRDTFQLSFLSPPVNTHHGSVQTDTLASYKTYQPTPPIDSDSDSSSDRFAARFAVAVQDEDRDEDMMDDGFAMSQNSDLPWWRAPEVVIGPPTPVSETGPGLGRLDMGGDVDMDLRLRAAGGAGAVVDSVGGTATEKKKVGLFKMGFRADCEKCRMRMPGHYSHY